MNVISIKLFDYFDYLYTDFTIYFVISEFSSNLFIESCYVKWSVYQLHSALTLWALNGDLYC